MILKDKGITFPRGFKAWGAHVGLKYKNKDLTLLTSDDQAVFSGLFTQNKVKAAPVVWNEALHKDEKGVKALIINSGNANACTGQRGMEDVHRTVKKVSQEVSCKQEEVLVASTGVIGVPLPIDKLLDGVEFIYPKLSRGEDASRCAAMGIMTTDTYVKQGGIQLLIEGKMVCIGGMAKGSGMIHPNMATMLSFVTTDVKIDKVTLQKIMKEIVEESYNMISVDGDTSTNDMVLTLANGASGVEIIDGTKEYMLFKSAIRQLHIYLAKEIVGDGEGAGKTIEVVVQGANNLKDARLLAKSIISSSLVKTAFFGEDANWGRILCSMGYAGVHFDENKLTITFENANQRLVVYRDGVPINFSEEKALEILQQDKIIVGIHLQDGEGKATAWGCDLSYEYVRINGDYRT